MTEPSDEGLMKVYGLVSWHKYFSMFEETSCVYGGVSDILRSYMSCTFVGMEHRHHSMQIARGFDSEMNDCFGDLVGLSKTFTKSILELNICAGIGSNCRILIFPCMKIVLLSGSQDRDHMDRCSICQKCRISSTNNSNNKNDRNHNGHQFACNESKKAYFDYIDSVLQCIKDLNRKTRKPSIDKMRAERYESIFLPKINHLIKCYLAFEKRKNNEVNIDTFRKKIENEANNINTIGDGLMSSLLKHRALSLASNQFKSHKIQQFIKKYQNDGNIFAKAEPDGSNGFRLIGRASLTGNNNFNKKANHEPARKNRKVMKTRRNQDSNHISRKTKESQIPNLKEHNFKHEKRLSMSHSPKRKSNTFENNNQNKDSWRKSRKRKRDDNKDDYSQNDSASDGDSSDDRSDTQLMKNRKRKSHSQSQLEIIKNEIKMDQRKEKEDSISMMTYENDNNTGDDMSDNSNSKPQRKRRRIMKTRTNEKNKNEKRENVKRVLEKEKKHEKKQSMSHSPNMRKKHNLTIMTKSKGIENNKNNNNNNNDSLRKSRKRKRDDLSDCDNESDASRITYESDNKDDYSQSDSASDDDMSDELNDKQLRQNRKRKSHSQSQLEIITNEVRMDKRKEKKSNVSMMRYENDNSTDDDMSDMIDSDATSHSKSKFKVGNNMTDDYSQSENTSENSTDDDMGDESLIQDRKRERINNRESRQSHSQSQLKIMANKIKRKSKMETRESESSDNDIEDDLRKEGKRRKKEESRESRQSKWNMGKHQRKGKEKMARIESLQCDSKGSKHFSNENNEMIKGKRDRNGRSHTFSPKSRYSRAYPPMYSPMYPPIYSPIYPPMYPSMYPPIHPPIYPPIYPPMAH